MNKNLYTLALAATLITASCSKPKAISSVAEEKAITDVTKLRAAAPTYAATITAADLTKHLTVIASDEYEGRDTGEKGQKMAAEYISKQFKEDGLIGPVKDGSNPYYQTFNLEKTSWDEGYVTIDAKKFIFLDDFYVQGDPTFSTEQNLETVFVGYGIEDSAYTDYTNVDVTGKVALMFVGEPTNRQGKSLITQTSKPSAWSTDWKKKSTVAAQKGALAVVLISSRTSQDEFNQYVARIKAVAERASVKFPKEKAEAPEVPGIFIGPEMGGRLLNATTRNLTAYHGQVSKASQAIASPFKPIRTIQVKLARKREPLPTENVLGLVEGTDKKDEIVVVTAHYDHVGVQDGKVYNGADDDGSGTVTVLELAQAFAQAKKDGFGPRRSVLFMTVTGEEKGLLGSEYYTDHPVLPLENTVVDLNIDMIGRLDKEHENDKNYVYVIGSDKLSSELHAINEAANKQYTQLKLDYRFNDPEDPNRFYYRSDHYNFAKHNIPVAFFFNGVHDDYHQDTDEVDKILFDKIEKIGRLVFNTTWELANRDDRIKVDSNKK
ncbi:M28 family peptidase [Adhaeribacter pallidiroseus]|uniref:Bacterial leucyl aminopeptidase n=1 Tax=Adhaeribacter pallidiroseus TaxID=2072847 RepID=A0A369QMP5_9BACT|nr:M28 family peptidase [Adhaeribacter pallidiroseus]RDC66211.1 Bacterial leucyl aminopeptidase [Adhaeribacter pallidiroseus]